MPWYVWLGAWLTASLLCGFNVAYAAVWFVGWVARKVAVKPKIKVAGKAG